MVQGNPVSVERETRTLTYEYSCEGDYYKGNYHIFVKFYDPATHSRCYISKIHDNTVINEDNPYGLVPDKQYQVSGYFVPEHAFVTDETRYFILNPRISGIKGADGRETILTFVYPSYATDDANRLCNLFDKNSIEYKCYDIESGYPIQFNVCRSGKGWDHIIKLINSVKAAKYRYRKLFVDRTGGLLRFRDM